MAKVQVMDQVKDLVMDLVKDLVKDLANDHHQLVKLKYSLELHCQHQSRRRHQLFQRE